MNQIELMQLFYFVMSCASCMAATDWWRMEATSPMRAISGVG